MDPVSVRPWSPLPHGGVDLSAVVSGSMFPGFAVPERKSAPQREHSTPKKLSSGGGIPRACIFQSDDLVCLRALASLDDVELDLIALFETLISIYLNRAVMHEDVWSAFTTEKAVAFRVVKPLHNTPILCQCRTLLAAVSNPCLGSFGVRRKSRARRFPHCDCKLVGCRTNVSGFSRVNWW